MGTAIEQYIHSRVDVSTPPNAQNVATLSALPTKVGFGAAHQNLGATAWLPNQGCRRAALCAALGYLSD